MNRSAAEITARLSALEALMGDRCDCREQLLEVRARTFAGGSKHLVLQCTGCGEQRGNALKAKDAQARLAGATAAPFDMALEEAYKDRRANICDEHAELHQELLLLVRPEVMAEISALKEAREEQAQRVQAAIERCTAEIVGEVGEAFAADALAKRAVALRTELRKALLASTVRFRSEAELKQWLVEHLSEDFHLYPEVVGTHATEGARVQIDYIAFPKPHLVDAGFVAAHFGVEVKYINQEDGFSHKSSRGLWQAVSYTDSKFQLEGNQVRLKFALLFSNLSFDNELMLLEHLGREYQNDYAAWRGLLQLANHANVGTLEVKGAREAWKGWKVVFSSGSYFSRSTYEGQSSYRLSNSRMVEKVRIGNF